MAVSSLYRRFSRPVPVRARKARGRFARSTQACHACRPRGAKHRAIGTRALSAMHVQARRFCQLAAALLALATILGALGAHALRGRLSADHYEVLQTALHYQFFHALGLLGVGL